MKLIASIMGMILSAIVTIWAMQSGWGLTAHSWPVIIWAIVFQLVLMMVQIALSREDGK